LLDVVQKVLFKILRNELDHREDCEMNGNLKKRGSTLESWSSSMMNDGFIMRGLAWTHVCIHGTGAIFAKSHADAQHKFWFCWRRRRRSILPTRQLQSHLIQRQML
jgi:hypothetical protein